MSVMISEFIQSPFFLNTPFIIIDNNMEDPQRYVVELTQTPRA